jgi:hypothetical protein
LAVGAGGAAVRYTVDDKSVEIALGSKRDDGESGGLQNMNGARFRVVVVAPGRHAALVSVGRARADRAQRSDLKRVGSVRRCHRHHGKQDGGRDPKPCARPRSGRAR